MSSEDGYFEGVDDFDESALQQLDAIEAAHLSPSKPAPSAATRPQRPPPRSEDSFDLSFDVDETELAKLDNFIADAYEGKAKPVAGPSNLNRTSSNNMLQTTLFGDVLPSAPAGPSKPKSQVERPKAAPRNPFGQQAPKTKTWDYEENAKLDAQKPSAKRKGKGRAGDDQEEEEEEVEFEQYPTERRPVIGLSRNLLLYRPPPPMRVKPDLLEAKHWIFPINRPKRDYQFNIVKNSLFENTLVALPTGLGKTFIAGVVMLNYYRWFPDGKVIFVAPTKPLVAQQVQACHETCGIPAVDRTEMNGEVPAAIRAKLWEDRRVFFMTPQTLVNDVKANRCDVSSIVLLVIDEAHRATGDYAYNQAIRKITAMNPHFRVLALTATPGNNPEAIQRLIDGLHISRIEIRDENSLDLKQYIHTKHFAPHIIKPNEDLAKVKDHLVKLMDPHFKTLQKAGVLFPSETPTSLHPYRPQKLMLDMKNRNFFWPLSVLSKLARAMLYLLTGSFRTCYEYLEGLIAGKEDDDDGVGGGKKKKKGGKNFTDDPNFRALMQELQAQRARGWGSHPKIEKLKEILINHFGSKLPDEPGGEEDNTRVMVFSSFRGVVEDLVEALDKDRPLIRAARFIGQGTDKQGKKGMSQKEQLEVINKFKAGEYNVLVATSIGEEGLDIGEIDITVCYDADKAPTRMVQRFGRTGRKRDGYIHALLAEGREEKNIDAADLKYKEVQKVVHKGEMYELYGDVERLIPDHIKPECIEKVVEINEYIREDHKKTRSPSKAKTGKHSAAMQGTKRKRNDDYTRNIPDGASTGFVSVKDLVVKGAKKPKKVKVVKDFDACGLDDETDEDIESGRILAAPRRTQSAAAGPSATEKSAKSVGKGKLKKAATMGGTKSSTKSKKKKKVEESTSSQFSKQGADDSDDMDIEQGAILPASHVHSKKRYIESPTPEASPRASSSKGGTASPKVSRLRQDDASAIEISDSEESDMPLSKFSSNPSNKPTRAASPHMNVDDEEDMSWLVQDDDDDDRAFEIRDSSDSSPVLLRHSVAKAFERVEVGDESIEISHPVPRDTVIDIVETSDPEELFEANPTSTLSSRHRRVSPSLVSQPEKMGATFRPASSLKRSASPTWNPSSSPLYPELPSNPKGKTAMLPPPVPVRKAGSPIQPTEDIPEPSYPVRPAGNQGKKRRIIFDEPESPAIDIDAEDAQPRRLRRIESTPVQPSKKKRRKHAKPSLLDRKANPLFDGEAAHSGEDTSEGYSDSADDVESESDRQFIKDSPLTQMPGSYEQTQIYRRSLFTQAGGDGPLFRNGPVRAKPFGRIDVKSRPRMLSSSSPPPPDDELDQYVMGSFIVDDDAEISYDA
ncbi:hypothetical protein CVT26_009353 [Gymnopilus dilepis]|uniref:ATP-dependent DNA helicase n=1 Tax=Gymnopilus dilepis TaxID=231916 RepID=A0A409WCG9_9AGAR|nr:hypothetical protein CVT26_009353 [Gymnopilus dilepis]